MPAAAGMVAVAAKAEAVAVVKEEAATRAVARWPAVAEEAAARQPLVEAEVAGGVVAK
jgi:hypothetical protein